MAHELSYLEALARETHKSEAEVMTWAFQKGLAQLWEIISWDDSCAVRLPARRPSMMSGLIGWNWPNVSRKQCWRICGGR